MRSFLVRITVIIVALLILTSGCRANKMDDTDPGDAGILNSPVDISPDPIPYSQPAITPTPIPTPEASPDNEEDAKYQELIKQMNNSIGKLSGLIIGLFTARGEQRDNRTIAIIFHAVDMEVDYLGISVHLAEQIRPYVVPNLSLMLAAGMKDPQIVLEFQDMIGEVIYTRVITLNDDQVEETSPSSVVEVTPPVETESPTADDDAILRFLRSQQAIIDKVRAEMEGMGTFSIVARDSRTIACVVNITDTSVSDKVTEERIDKEVMPMLKATFEQYVPALAAAGVSDPRVIVEVYNPEGKLLLSTVFS